MPPNCARIACARDRDSLYVRAESYARRAVAAKGDGAEGHFALANAIGRSTLSMGARERVKRQFTWDQAGKRTLEGYEAVLTRRRDAVAAHE